MRSNTPRLLLAAAFVLAAASILWIFFAPTAGSRTNGAPESPGATSHSGSPDDAALAERGAGGRPPIPIPSVKPTAVADTEAPGPASDGPVRESLAVEREPKGFACGRVVDADGKPAENAKVYIVGKSGSVSFLGADAETNAAGEFKVSTTVKRKKTLGLRVSRKDRLPIEVADVVFRPDETFDVGTLVFPPSGAIEARVVDSDGNPVPNCTISLERRDGGPDPRGADELDWEAGSKDQARALRMFSELSRSRRMTDEDGVARFTAVEPGRVLVKATPPAPDAGDSIRANVNTDSGLHVGVKASVDDSPPRSSDDATATPPLAKPAPKEVDVAAGTTANVSLTLTGLAIVMGRATVHGQPLRNEVLGLHASSLAGSFLGRIGMHVRARTDAEGRFRFPPVAPGSYVVKKGDPGQSSNILNFGGDDAMESMMEMVSNMMKPANNPERDLGRQIDARTGTNRFDVEFGGTTLEVIVQDLDTGAPVAGATIRLFDRPAAVDKGANAKSSALDRLAERFVARGGQRPVRLRAQADARGRAEFTELQGGAYRIIARSDGRPPSHDCDFDLVEGQYARAVVKVPRGTTVWGSVNDRSGNALRNASVTALPAPGRDLEPMFPDEVLSMLGPSSPTDSTNSKGRFRLDGLEAGRHWILAVADGFAPAALQVTAPSEGNDLFLEKPGSIRVTVTHDGKPAKGILVSLDTNAEDAPLPSAAWSSPLLLVQTWQAAAATTDEAGMAVLKSVPPGEWTVQAVNLFGPQIELDNALNALGSNAGGGEGVGAVQDGPPKRSAEELQALAEKYLTSRKTKVRVFPESEATASINLDAK